MLRMSRWAFSCAFALLPLLALRASDDSYHDVPLKGGEKQTVIRVKDVSAPHMDDAPADGKYSPTNLDLSRTSALAHKSFSSTSAGVGRNDVAPESQSVPFATRSFATTPDPNFQKPYKAQVFAFSGRSDSQFQRTFPTATSSLNTGKTFSTTASTLQGKTAVLPPNKMDPFATPSSLNGKTFFDPEMTHVKRDPYSASSGLDVTRLADLPNRPLSIDEVRELINHETIPNLKEKPETASKPLNDPAYEPPVALPEAKGSDRPPTEEEKDSNLPPPGTMAQPPENAEALPK